VYLTQPASTLKSSILFVGELSEMGGQWWHFYLGSSLNGTNQRAGVVLWACALATWMRQRETDSCSPSTTLTTAALSSVPTTCATGSVYINGGEERNQYDLSLEKLLGGIFSACTCALQLPMICQEIGHLNEMSPRGRSPTSGSWAVNSLYEGAWWGNLEEISDATDWPEKLFKNR